MKIGLLIIASEVLDGKISDANTRYLAVLLNRHNLELCRMQTIRDSEKEIHEGLSSLLADCDVLITSGGLGPTRDDLTKSSLASFLGRSIHYSEAAELVARDNYERFGRHFAGKEHGYSWLPVEVIPLSNPAGMAPGLLAEHLGKWIFCAPGVPREFAAIMEEHLVPWLDRHLQTPEHIEHLTFRTKGVPEEKIFNELDPTLWDKLAACGEVSSLPMMMGVDIGVKIRGTSQDEILRKHKKVHDAVKSSPIFPHVWSFDLSAVEEVIVRKANALGMCYGFAESATGGLCSHKVTSVSGSSQTFHGSVVSYDNSVKQSALSVPEETIRSFGVVSTQTAEAMARGLLNALKLDLGVSITGVAGPSGGSEECPVGTVCIGVATKGQVRSIRRRFFGDRQMLKERFAQAALFELLEELEKFART